MLIRLYNDDTIDSVSLTKIPPPSNIGGEPEPPKQILKNNDFELRDTTIFDCFDSLSFDREDYIGWINDFEQNEMHPLNTTVEELCDSDSCIGVNLYSVNIIQDWHYEN